MSSLALSCASCSSEHPLTPVSVRHGVYAASDEASVIYIASLDSLVVVDSILGIGPAFGITPSSDGAYLYISGDHPLLGRSLIKYSLERRSVDLSVPTTTLRHHPLLVLGGRGILSGPNPRVILDVSTFTQIARIPDGLLVENAVDADSLVATRQDSSITYRELNVMTGQFHGQYRPQLKNGAVLEEGYLYSVVYNSRARAIALIFGQTRQGNYFLYGDMLTGETLIERKLTFPYGDIAISPDGGLLAVSDPGNYGVGDQSDVYVDIFDLRSFELIRRLQEFEDDLETCARLQFTPESDQILTIPGVGPDGGRGGALQLIDLSDFSVRLTRHVPDSLIGLSGVAIGPIR